MGFLEELNEEQRQAVLTTEGYVRVIAGAGTGKTRTLTGRYLHLVEELFLSTANLLCVTFTNKAANVMKKRIRSMIGDYDAGLICTFHGFCAQLLREDIHVMNYPPNFTVLDGEDMDSLLKNVYEETGLSKKDYTFEQAKDQISLRKYREGYIENILEMDAEMLKKKEREAKKKEEQMFYGFLYEQKKCYGLDYDDLILFALFILKHFKEKREKWQRRLEYIMVDEFQDVNASQYQLVKILSAYHKNLFVVGDPDQTIYTWRGAKIEFLLNFDREFSDVKTIVMEKNYRSANRILQASNSLIQKNEKRYEKKLSAVRKEEGPVLYHHSKTEKEEANWIEGKIKELIKTGKKYDDFAVLYRSHHVSRAVEEVFIRQKIPYILYNGVEFYRRKEIKDVLSYLRMITSADDLSFLRVVNQPRRNIGKKRIELLKEYAKMYDCTLFEALKKNRTDILFKKSGAKDFIELIEKYRGQHTFMKLTDLTTAILNDSGYEAMLRVSGDEERLENIAEWKQSIFEYEKNVGEDVRLLDYLQEISLFTDIEREERKESVKMMTVHTAKGMEFPYVFLCGANEGIFPNRHANTQTWMEEERRLFYVGMTRARDGLFLSDSGGFDLEGLCRYPSRFVFDIDPAYLTYEEELGESFLEEAISYIQLEERRIRAIENLYPVGTVIVHKWFGIGKILEVNREESNYIIQFERMKTPRSLNIAAPLERMK